MVRVPCCCVNARCHTAGAKRRRSASTEGAEAPAPKRARVTPTALRNDHGHLQRGPLFNIPVPKQARAPGAPLLEFVEAAEGSGGAESLEAAMAGVGFYSRSFEYSERARVDLLARWTRLGKGPGGPEATADWVAGFAKVDATWRVQRESVGGQIVRALKRNSDWLLALRSGVGSMQLQAPDERMAELLGNLGTTLDNILYEQLVATASAAMVDQCRDIPGHLRGEARLQAEAEYNALAKKKHSVSPDLFQFESAFRGSARSKRFFKGEKQQQQAFYQQPRVFAHPPYFAPPGGTTRRGGRGAGRGRGRGRGRARS